MGYILVLLAAVLSIWASARVNSVYSKFAKINTARNLTATQVTRKILDQNGLNHVGIEAIGGNLTDHYDPKANVIRLSDTVRNSSSIAAVGVAAHEAGHAVQHATGYAPIKVRNAIVPIASFGSKLGPYLIILGIVFSAAGGIWDSMLTLGIWLFAAAVLFQIITLPVEFNASSRAIKTLDESGYLSSEEIPGVKKVLGAAAMTYLAAAAVSIANLFRFILIAQNGRGRKN